MPAHHFDIHQSISKQILRSTSLFSLLLSLAAHLPIGFTNQSIPSHRLDERHYPFPNRSMLHIHYDFIYPPPRITWLLSSSLFVAPSYMIPCSVPTYDSIHRVTPSFNHTVQFCTISSIALRRSRKTLFFELHFLVTVWNLLFKHSQHFKPIVISKCLSQSILAYDYTLDRILSNIINHSFQTYHSEYIVLIIGSAFIHRLPFNSTTSSHL